MSDLLHCWQLWSLADSQRAGAGAIGGSAWAGRLACDSLRWPTPGPAVSTENPRTCRCWLLLVHMAGRGRILPGGHQTQSSSGEALRTARASAQPNTISPARLWATSSPCLARIDKQPPSRHRAASQQKFCKFRNFVSVDCRTRQVSSHNPLLCIRNEEARNAKAAYLGRPPPTRILTLFRVQDDVIPPKREPGARS